MVTTEDVRVALDAVADPEIPVLTIADLGVLRDVTMEGGTLVVTITPTYSGCPAMDVIRAEVSAVVDRLWDGPHEVRTVLSPAWTTAWMSDEGKAKLDAYGIAPPGGEVTCPRCRTVEPRLVSEFGSTACKALYVCSSCAEPFDHFKDI